MPNILSMRSLLFLTLALSVAVLSCCTGLAPEQNAELIDLGARIAELGRQIRESGATPELLAELAAAVARSNELRELGQQSGGSIAWDQVLTGAAAIAGSLFGVRIWRGGVNDRKGEAPASAAS